MDVNKSFDEVSRRDEAPYILNPNCSEVIWRLKGHSEHYEGTNQEPYAVFIEEILEIFSQLGWNKAKILAAEPIYIKGDGGPDTLEWSFKYAQDLVAGIRDPRELDSDEDLDNQIVERGYDEDVSRTWDPLVTEPRNPNDSLNRAEELLELLKQNDQGGTRPRRSMPGGRKPTKQAAKKAVRKTTGKKAVKPR
jgi:hypothetical protein